MSFHCFIKNHVLYWFLVFLVSIMLFLLVATMESDLVYSPVIKESASEVYSVVGSIKNETQGFVKNGTSFIYIKPSFEYKVGVLFKTLGVIYFNNALLNTLYIIPFTGTATYISSLVHTSLVSKYISMEMRQNWFRNIVETVVLSPHTYVELLAYSITIVESTYIGLVYIKSLIRKKWIVDERSIAYSLYSIGLSYVILLVASIVESILIILK